MVINKCISQTRNEKKWFFVSNDDDDYETDTFIFDKKQKVKGKPEGDEKPAMLALPKMEGKSNNKN